MRQPWRRWAAGAVGSRQQQHQQAAGAVGSRQQTMPPVFSKLQRPWPGFVIDATASSWGVLRQSQTVIVLDADAVDLDESDDSDVLFNFDDVQLSLPGCVELPLLASQEERLTLWTLQM